MPRRRIALKPPHYLTCLGLSGFKSHFEETKLTLGRLTILGGANSSGKSSVMQPLLLLKQTVDALPLDVGALKLDGPNVHFSDAEQFLSVRPGVARAKNLKLFLEIGAKSAQLVFRGKPPTVELDHVVYTSGEHRLTLKEKEVIKSDRFGEVTPFCQIPLPEGVAGELSVGRYGSFLTIEGGSLRSLPSPSDKLLNKLKNLIHIPGLRGNPIRNYARTVPGTGHPGVFHERVAGLISFWQEKKDSRLQKLNDALMKVGLTWKVESRVLDAANLELRVGRTVESSRKPTRDTVNIADVGFGVSQALPILTALVAAVPGQIVYCEQPEIHLHPRAQKGVADMLAEAARRGVQVIVETHSEIILSRLQWHIAKPEERLVPGSVIAHWFERDPRTGVTKVRTNVPDETGAFGDWPVDFADVAAEVDQEYADAAYARLPMDPA
jgi:hypothetical protein